MRRNVLTIYAVLLSISLSAQVGINTTNPDPSSVLDIQSPDKGVLLPRVNLENLTQHISGTTNAVGLLIYNIGSTTIPKGFYAWDGESWVQFVDEGKLKKSMFWAPQGVSTTTQKKISKTSGKAIGETQEEGTTETPIDVSIFQKGKVGIGYSTESEINFEDNPTQKQLEVGGDFRTVTWVDKENKIHPITQIPYTLAPQFYGIETNSVALPEKLTTRGNVMYSASTKDLKAYSDYNKTFDGNMILQTEDQFHVLSKKGNAHDTEGNRTYQYTSTSDGAYEFVSTLKLNPYKPTSKLRFFNSDVFYVADDDDSNIKFGLDFIKKKFFIGDNTDGVDPYGTPIKGEAYFFPTKKGTDGQVLKLNATTSSLEWANESGETGTNNAQKFFYMPSIVIDTKAVKQGVKRNLYAEYVAQFSNKKFEMDETGGKIVDEARATFVKSTNAPNVIPYLPNSKDLYYYVTDYDTTALENLFIDEDGILTYDVKGAGTDYSFINIVFVIK